MNNRPKRNTPAGGAPQRATSGQNVPKSGERANAGTRRYCRGPHKAVWLCGERRSSGASEFCRLRRNSRYVACDDEAGSLFGENGKGKWREHMRENPYKRLPPIERKPDGSLYRMAPAQRKQANALIRRECCCYEDGNCMLLDDGDTHTCPQTISFSVCCKWFRWSVLPQIGTLEAEIFRDKELKRCAVCGRVFVPKSNRAKYCPDCAARVHRRQKTESERKRRSCVDS